jgi:hypothetical protein
MREWLRNKIKEQKDKAMGRATKVVEKSLAFKLRNRTFDQNAAAVRRMIPLAGTFEIRKNLLSGIKTDIKEQVAKGKTDEEILQPCIDSPNFRMLLNELDLNFDHIKVIVKEARNEN